MKILILTSTIMCILTVAQAQEKSVTATSKTTTTKEVQEYKEPGKMDMQKMHEQMAKAHQSAADCLKSGKSREECQTAFRKSCDEAGPGKCGPWDGPGSMHKGRMRK